VRDGERERRIQIAGMRLLFEQNGIAETDRIRPLHIMAVTGAAAVGLVVLTFADLSIYRVVAWCLIVFVGETIVTAINLRYAASRPADEQMRPWAMAKTAASAFNAVAWSLGVLLLHAPGSLLSVLAPVWGIVNFMAATIWVAATFAPAMYFMIAASALPAAAFLLSFRGGVELHVGVCLVVSIPYMTWLGSLALKNMREGISHRLEIADLSATQAAQAEEIRKLFAERTRFFSAASHDLRQPLSAMSYYFALLERARTLSERDEIVIRLQDCANSLQRQFDSIMGVSEADAAIMRAAESSVSLQSMFDRIATTLRPDADRKSLVLRVAPTSLAVRADPDLLFRVLTNVAANSIKYTLDGGVLIGARRRGREIVVQVVDTGIGIEKADMGAVFDDYFQVGNPQRDSRKGLGLGLGIVRRICDAMNWRIGMTSQPGRGTIVSLALLRAEQPALATTAGANNGEGNGETAGDHVLVVDDDLHIRDSLGRLLGSWGYACHACATRAEALAAIATHGGDHAWRALIDWRLGGEESGLDVAEQLREAYGDRVMVTLMTGDLDPSIEKEARNRGIPVLRKPVQPIRLRSILAAPQVDLSKSV
jgi:signal transduction histidine kinase